MCDLESSIRYVRLKNFVRAALFFEESLLFQFDIMNNFHDDFASLVKSVCRQYPSHSVREKVDILLSLINKKWLDPSRNLYLRQKKAVDTYISFFTASPLSLSSSLPVYNDSFVKIVSEYPEEGVCEETVLADIANGLQFDDDGTIVSLNAIGSNFFVLEHEAYTRILELAKKRFGFSTKGCIDLDDFVQKSVLEYFRELCDVDVLAQEAYLSTDYMQFQKTAGQMLEVPSSEISIRHTYAESGYRTTFMGSIEHPRTAL